MWNTTDTNGERARARGARPFDWAETFVLSLVFIVGLSLSAGMLFVVAHFVWKYW
jgi:hypothetical protein